jgi:flagellar hook-associated protein 1 FlgK
MAIMGLQVALTTARSSLAATGVQTSTISRNIAGANEGNVSRKNAALATMPGGGVYVSTIQRAADNGVFRHLLNATSDSAKQNTVYNAIAAMSGATVDDPENDHSPAAKLSALTTALDQYALTPDDVTLAQSFVTAAKNMAQSLNDATTQIQKTREQADAEMAISVDKIKDLLDRFESLNATIVRGTIAGVDTTDYEDMRDEVASQLSQEIGVRVETRANNDQAIYTDSGVTLFETTARSVEFAPTFAYDATIGGNAVYIDGVAVTGTSATMEIESGNLAGLADIRDKTSVTYQSQLDEIARGLIEIFAESDQDGAPVSPTLAGVFTYAGGPAMPTTGVVNVGLAGTIEVNALIDPSQGGNPSLVRDGGINGAPTYVYNTGGEAGFPARLDGLVSALHVDRTFDPTTLAKPSGTLIDFASSSTSWIESQRATADEGATYQTTLVQRSAEALSNTRGINMDDEMILMQQIERTFTASSKLIATVDVMLQNLLDAVGN